MTPVPDPARALSVARLHSNPATVVKAVSQGIYRGIETGSTVPHLINPAAVTDPDTATTVSSHTLPAATTPLEDVPAPSLAGEHPAWVGTDSTPTGAGTTRGTAAASATGVCREAGTGRDGDSLCQQTGCKLVPSTSAIIRVLFFPYR
jgi:hypothetical protein